MSDDRVNYYSNKVIRIIKDNLSLFPILEDLYRGMELSKTEKYFGFQLQKLLRNDIVKGIEHLDYFWFTVPTKQLEFMEHLMQKRILIDHLNRFPTKKDSDDFDKLCKKEFPTL